jgi:hypothetical protein
MIKKTNNRNFTYGTFQIPNVKNPDIMTKQTHIAKQKQGNYTASVKMQTTCSKPTHYSPNDMADSYEYRLVKKFQEGITMPTFRMHSSDHVNLVLLLFR